MPRYDYKCGAGHVTERTQSIVEDVPAEVKCDHAAEPHTRREVCGRAAARVFTAPDVIFKGPGFYSTDVTGRVNRRRRKNPGDSLHRDYDHAAARIADGI